MLADAGTWVVPAPRPPVLTRRIGSYSFLCPETETLTAHVNAITMRMAAIALNIPEQEVNFIAEERGKAIGDALRIVLSKPPPDARCHR